MNSIARCPVFLGFLLDTFKLTEIESIVNHEIRIVNHSKPDKKDGYHLKVLQKVFRLLEIFSEEVQELSAAEITQRLNYDKTTVFRLLFNLEEEGYLDKDPKTNKYRLGMKIFFLGNLVSPYLCLKEMAKPLLERLNEKSGETVHLAVLHKGEALYVDKIESKRTVRVVLSQVGRKLPAHCSGVGKVLLAYLPPEKVEEIVTEKGLAPFTQNTITTYDQLKAELRRIARQNLAFDNEEIEIGLKCVAAPVFFEDQVTAALSVSVPSMRFDDNREELARMVTDIAEELTTVLNQNLRGRKWW